MKTCPTCATENPKASQRCAACGVALEIEKPKVVATIRVGSRNIVPGSDSDSSVHGRFLPGTKIAERYRIVSLAGRGGMGEVYRADDLNLEASRGPKIPAARRQGGFSVLSSFSSFPPVPKKNSAVVASPSP